MVKCVRVCVAVTLAAVLLLASTAITYAADEITVTIDGQAVVFQDQAPVIVDSRTLVPVRGVFEHLGFAVEWETHAPQTATLRRADFVVHITVGSEDFTTNGVAHRLDVPAQVINDRTMIPLRAVLESVGYYLDWDGATQTVLISSVPFQAVVPPVGEIPAYVTILGVERRTGLGWLSLSVSAEDRHLLSDEAILPLRHMVNLVELSMGGIPRLEAPLTDLSPLTNLTNLRYLSVFSTHISDVTPLTGLTNLSRLTLQFNRIEDITPLENLTNLTFVNLTENQITDLTSLAGLTNLQTLVLGHNQITDLTPLAGLTNLQRLVLDDNQITDWSPVAHVENVGGRP